LIEASRPSPRITANVPHNGRPGTASVRLPQPDATATAVSAARGGTRSATESTVVAPSSWANAEPNMLSADSSGDPVRAYTRVPSARLLSVEAATCADDATNNGVNSRVRNSSR
jgi:hypothetical protein